MLAANLTGRRCITHERGINDRYTSGAKYLGKRLDAVICISEAVRRNMVEGGADFGNLVTIYNGLDPAVMRVGTPADELRRRHGLRPEHAIVGMPGNIRAWKGQDTLVRAMDLVRRECPNARCLLIGDMAASDRPYGDMLAELASSLGLQDYIILTGFQKNVADYLNLCDVVVHASVRPEPFGRVILDAMACRKPVVGSRAGAIPEIIEEGKTGLTFPPGDSEQLARAIITLIKDRSAARRLGENGYQRLIEQFNIDRNVDATVRLYGRLLGAAH
jgi:glycosyltransferase involved in cell wall biosynthesis